MASAFSLSHAGTTKHFKTPPAGTSVEEVRRTIASSFSLPVGCFGIFSRGGGEVVFIHAGLQGDFDLVLIPGQFEWH